MDSSGIYQIIQKAIPSIWGAQNVYRTPGLQAWFSTRSRSLIEFLARSLINYAAGQLPLNRLKELRNQKKDCPALVIGGGRSVDKITKEWLQENISLNALSVYSVNMSYRTKLAKSLGVNCYVLSDPAHELMRNKDLLADLQNELSVGEDKLLFIPRHWKRPIELRDEQVIGFEDVPLHYLGLGIDPTRPRHYPSLTLYKAVALAIYCGHSPIYLIGADHDQLSGIRVNSKNEVFELSTHAEGAASQSFHKLSLTHGLEDLYQEAAWVNSTLRRYFSNKPILNLNPESHADFINKFDATKSQ